VAFVLSSGKKNVIFSLSSINTTAHKSRGLGHRGDVFEVVLDLYIARNSRTTTNILINLSLP